MEQQLAEEPPADRLIAMYFAANKWWEPPARGGTAAEPADDEDLEIWECPFPETTE
jgi:hypothetical protein